MIETDYLLRGVSAANGSTKAKIERAALVLFADHGIDGVSTKQIAKKAGISEGAIYRHFSGKEDLARTLMLSIHTRLTDMIRIAGEQEDGLERQISFIVRHYCAIADEDWILFQYHILHLHHFAQLSDSMHHSPMAASAKIIEAAMQRGEIRVSDPNIVASMALGVVLQTAQSKVLGYIDGPLAARSTQFIEGVFAVLGLNAEYLS